jgi:hypothetical protein
MHTAQDARADPKEYDFIIREIVFVETDRNRSSSHGISTSALKASRSLHFTTGCDGRRRLSYMDLRHPSDISGNSRMSVGSLSTQRRSRSRPPSRAGESKSLLGRPPFVTVRPQLVAFPYDRSFAILITCFRSKLWPSPSIDFFLSSEPKSEGFSYRAAFLRLLQPGSRRGSVLLLRFYGGQEALQFPRKQSP